jgi:8-oxo-dGTP pyrophosphatase MutT (NUDIX family)
MRPKRLVSILIPYRVINNEIYVYLQKRGMDMERLPGWFGLWGGGVDEDETPEQGLKREVQEELGFDVTKYRYAFHNQYEFLAAIEHVFIFEAQQNFESKVVIGEGEYGKWFSAEEAFKLPNLIFEAKIIINDLERSLLKKPIR